MFYLFESAVTMVLAEFQLFLFNWMNYILQGIIEKDGIKSNYIQDAN